MIEKTSFENYHKSMEKIMIKFKNGKYKSYLETFKSKFLKKISYAKFDDKIVLNSYANATKSAIKLKDELNSILILNLYKRSVLLNNDFSDNISFKEIFDVKNDNDEKIKKIRLDIQILFDDDINIDRIDRLDLLRDDYMKYKLSKNKLFFTSEMKKTKIKDEDILLLFGVEKKVLNGIFSNNFRRVFAFIFDILIGALKAAIAALVFYWYIPLSIFVGTTAFWLHFAMSESGKQRRTVGKRIMGLRVVGINGGKISFMRASIRFFLKILGVFTFTYLFAILTRRRRSLHDIFTKTLVVKEKYLPVVRKGPKPRGSSGGGGGISIDVD